MTWHQPTNSLGRTIFERLERVNKFEPVAGFIVGFALKIHKLIVNKGWCALQVSNLRPLPCEGNALPLS